MNITNINVRPVSHIAEFIFLFAAFAIGIVFPSALSAATYTVININDSGVGSLRQAIIDANATTADDTITFNIIDCPNGVCTITLSSGELAINATSTAGKLTVTNSTGANNLLISGNNASRVFYVKGNANLTLNGVTITGGNGTGTTWTGINGNGGGILTESGTSILTLTNSTVSGNSTNSTNSQGGGGIFLNGGSLTLTGSTIAGNTAMTNGGGIFLNSGTTTTINNSTVSSNSSPKGFGGGIIKYSGSLTITDSTISGNSTKYDGGGIDNLGGTIAITNSTISGNVAMQQFGGGIYNSGSGVVTLTNSTVSGNSANFPNATGGGIHNGIGGTLNLNNVTVTGNRVSNVNCTTCAGGVWNQGNTNPSSTANLLNTIIAGNSVSNASSSPDIYGPVSSTGSFNLIGNGGGMNGITNGTNNNQVGTNANPIDARLAPLGNYGGATQTHALLSNSPAINAGSNCVIDLTCPSNNPPAALTTDQRGAGFPRKVGNAVDIGAVEFATPNAVFNNGQILFTSNRDGNNEIYKMNPDGSNQQRLTNSPESEGSGKWSPDNRKILYNKSINSTTNQIWVMNADGSNQTMISDATGNNVSNGWSPDGQKILFTKGETNSGERIWTMNADGSNKVQLTNTMMLDHLPVWSPDSMRIAFGRCDAAFVCDIFTMNADGSNQTNLTPDNPNDDDGPMWMPDGSKIVFGSQNTPDDYNAYVMNADGTNRQPLTNSSGTPYFYPAAISPNANTLALTSQSGALNSFEIFTVEISGSNLTNLTNNSAQDVFSSWSPDGTKIAFRSLRDSTRNEIYVMNADGSSVVRLTNNSANDFVTDWQSIPSYTVSTPAGQNTGVAPTGGTSLIFSSVTTAGSTTVTVLPADRVPPLPSGFSIFGGNAAYDITTSAIFSGSVTVTFQIPNVADAATCANLRSLHYENGAWITDTNAAPVYNAGTQICTVSQTVTSLSPFTVAGYLAPSAAEVNVGGRAVNEKGRGIAGVQITLTDADGNIRTIMTSAFGYYLFTGITAGEIIILNANAKRWAFNQSTRILSINEDTDNINFVGRTAFYDRE